MEKYAKKAKITVPTLKVKRSFDKRQALITLAIITQLIAFLTPWLWQKLAFAVIMHPELRYRIYPPPSIPEEAWVWSFMAVIKTAWNEWQVLLFLDYWFCSDMLLRNSLSPGISLLIFVFQSLTMISIFLTIKKGGFSSRLKILAPLLLSIGVLFFCILGIRAPSLGSYLQSQPFIGFWFALLSSLLFMLSFIFYKRDTN